MRERDGPYLLFVQGELTDFLTFFVTRVAISYSGFEVPKNDGRLSWGAGLSGCACFSIWANSEAADAVRVALEERLILCLNVSDDDRSTKRVDEVVLAPDFRCDHAILHVAGEANSGLEV